MRKFFLFVLCALMLAQTGFCANSGSDGSAGQYPGDAGGIKTDIYVSDYEGEYPEGMSEAAVVFVENFWVFDGDYKSGAFDDDAEGLYQAVEQISGLKDAMSDSDRAFAEVVEALDGFRTYKLTVSVMRFFDKLLVMEQAKQLFPGVEFGKLPWFTCRNEVFPRKLVRVI